MHPQRATLLLTRPEVQSHRFARSFREKFGSDWPILISPLVRIVWRDPGALPEIDADLIFTSENAVAGYARLTARRTGIAWCVGQRTEEAAQQHGFRTRIGPGDAQRLIETICREGAEKKYIWPRAVHASRDISQEMNFAGIDTISVIVYDQPTCEPTPEALLLMQRKVPVLLPLFSTRSALIASSAFPAPIAEVYVAAISQAVAKAATKLQARRLVVAERPDGSSMLSALGALIAADMTG